MPLLPKVYTFYSVVRTAGFNEPYEVCPNKSATLKFKKRIVSANVWGTDFASVLFKCRFASLT